MGLSLLTCDTPVTVEILWKHSRPFLERILERYLTWARIIEDTLEEFLGQKIKYLKIILKYIENFLIRLWFLSTLKGRLF